MDDRDHPPSIVKPRFTDYEVIRFISAGGFGTVWLCRHTANGGAFAVKVPHEATFTDAMRTLFEEECAKLIALSQCDPRLVQAKEVVEATLPSGVRLPALVMHYVDGERLDDWLRSRATTLTFRQRLGLFAQLCRAVQALHHRGVIHLDLKPSNFVVKEDGSPVLVDLGSAKLLLRRDPTPSGLTYAYASPEQLDLLDHTGKRPARLLDTSSDIYSLGKILAFMIAGPEVVELRGVEHGIDPAIAAKAWSPARLVEALPTCDRRVHEAIMDATRHEPMHRLRSWRGRVLGAVGLAPVHAIAGEFAYAVETLLDPCWRRIWDRSVRLVAELPKPVQRGLAVLLLALLSCILGILASNAIVAVSSRSAPPPLHRPVAFPDVRLIVIPYDISTEEISREAAELGVTDFDPAIRPTWRPLYGKVGERCARAGAKVFCFDIEIGLDHHTASTALLADSVKAMRARGCEVLFGTLKSWSANPPPEVFSPALASAGAEAACIEVQRSGDGWRLIPLVIRPLANAPAQGLALRAVLLFLGRGFAFDVDDVHDELRLLAPDGAKSPDAIPLFANTSAAQLASPDRPLSVPGTAIVSEIGVADPPDGALEDITWTLEELLAKNDAQRKAFLDGKIVVFSRACVVPPDGMPHDDVGDMERLDSGEWILKAYYHVLAIQALLGPQPGPMSDGVLMALMMLAAALGVVGGGRLAAMRARRRKAEELRLMSDQHADWRVFLVTLAAVALFIVGWIAVVLVDAAVPYASVNIVLAGAVGVLAGWTCVWLRAFSAGADAWMGSGKRS